jgi:hypothetical protein
MDDGFEHVFGRFNVFETGSIVDDLLIHVADGAVGDAALQNDRSIAKCQPDVVEGVQVQREGGLDQAAALADFLDGEWLENHHLAVELSENLNPIDVALFV